MGAVLAVIRGLLVSVEAKVGLKESPNGSICSLSWKKKDLVRK